MQTSFLTKPICHGLFSEHYLLKVFAGSDTFKSLTPPNGLYKQVAAELEKALRTVTKKNESQLEEDLIKPLLRALEIPFIVQVDIPGRGMADYAFFTSSEERENADRKSERKFETAAALADAKRWGRSLDARGGTVDDNNPNAIPSRQIANYLYDSGVSWGILTDGRYWRLYNRNVLPVSESFFEIDLTKACQDQSDFHLFYALFSGPAFTARSQDYVLRESERLWATIGDDLKGRAYDALELLCNGFKKHKSELAAGDIYEASVILLYRILFVLYAEKRGLLPVENEGYKAYSFEKLVREIDNTKEESFSEIRYRLYGQLRQLFEIIDHGDEGLGVYQYNGGLFKDEGLPFIPDGFLAANAVPDRFLARALKLIAFTEDRKTKNRRPVDYGELDVRHLGSIYEGLLEYHPREVDGGAIELVTDKGERKATGSYYTPEYIVNYIVDNTLGPLTADAKSPEDVLALKVLDPAMGSGHFLVGAVDFIGRRCAQLAGEEEEVREKEYQRFAVERCVYGVDLNPLAVELAKLSLWLHTVARDKPLSFLDYHFKVGNSLMGAYIANLGELPIHNANISKSDTKPAQTNIFETRLKEMMPAVLNEVMGILGRGTENITDIHDKEALYKAADAHLKPFRAVANLWVSYFFATDISKDEYSAALANIGRPEDLFKHVKVAIANEMNHGINGINGKHFFHWELEFPEVFFDEYGRRKDCPGFDAVIGNPPYVKASYVEATDSVEKWMRERRALEAFNYETLYGRWDLYLCFMERGYQLLKEGGYISLIVSKTIEITPYAGKARLYYSQNATLVQFDFFEGLDLFPGVGIENTIFLFRKYRPGRDNIIVRKHHKAIPFNMPYKTDTINQNTVGPRSFDPNYNTMFINRFANTIPFGFICYVCGGAQVHSDQIKRRGEFKKDDIITDLRVNSRQREYTEGKYIGRYSINKIKYLDYDFYKGLMKRPRFEALFDSEKVLVSGIDKVTYGGKGLLVNHSIIVAVKWSDLASSENASIDKSLFFLAELFNKPIKRTDLELSSVNYDIRFLLSIIGSAFARYLNMNILRRTNLSITENALKEIPIPEFDFSIDTRVRKESFNRLRETYSRSENPNLILSSAKELIDNGRSAAIHDFLAFLAQEMVDRNAKKNECVLQFLVWLKGETGRDISDFRPQKYMDFWLWSAEEFYQWLKVNSVVFEPSDYARFIEEFNKYKAFVNDFASNIEKLDFFIDEIVYTLYRLTNDEITIVDPKRAERLVHFGVR